MLTRRSFWLTGASAFMALGVVVGSVVADELIGTLTKVDTENKTITVVERKTKKEVDLKVDENTKIVAKRKGETKTSKVHLDRLEKRVKKLTDAGKKGIQVRVTHEDGTASKIQPVAKKGANAKGKGKGKGKAKAKVKD